MLGALETISRLLVAEGLQPFREGESCLGRDREETQKGPWLVEKMTTEQLGEK